jgi:hypothetical protein
MVDFEIGVIMLPNLQLNAGDRIGGTAVLVALEREGSHFPPAS